ncbi:MAG: PilZ domain-containing protein [Methyloligellaceae bacterium]
MEHLENRIARRVKVAIWAVVSDLRRFCSIDCLVRDASLTGCKIVSSKIADLPDEIYIEVMGLPQTIVGRIVWRSTRMAGVKFIWDAPEDLNRRTDRRVPIQFPVAISDTQHTRTFWGSICDASFSGCRIEIDQLGRVPDDIWLQVEGLTGEIRGRIVWRKGNQAGVRLLWSGDSTTPEAGASAEYRHKDYV